MIFNTDEKADVPLSIAPIPTEQRMPQVPL